MLLESGKLFVSLIDVAFVGKATGRSVQDENEIHLWHFDNQGLVTRIGHKCDTYQYWEAHRVECTEQAEGWLTNCVYTDRKNDAILSFFAVITKLHLCVGPVVLPSGHP